MNMTEIKTRVDEINTILLQYAATFPINGAMALLLDELEELQETCQHDFNDEGVCTICGAIKS